MISVPLIHGAVQALFVFVLVTAVFIITQRHIPSLFATYANQSLLLAAIAVMLYFENNEITFLFIALVTLITKAIVIPIVMKRIHKMMKINRDVEFHYLNPITSIIASISLVLLVYVFFRKSAPAIGLEGVHFLGAVLGVPLTFMGMLVIFSRKQAITKIIGYLTMEN